MEANRRGSLRSQVLMTPVKPKGPTKPTQQAIKDDFKALIDHFAEYKPNLISTPFEGTCLKTSNNEKNFIFASADGRIANCDKEKKQLILHHQIDESWHIKSIELTKSSEFLFVGTNSGAIYKFRFDTFEPKDIFERHKKDVIGLYLSENEEKLYSAGGRQVLKWNANDSSKCEELYTHSSQILSFCLSSDFVHLASGDSSGVFKIFNLFENQEKYVSPPLGFQITSMKISQKNEFLVLGTDSHGIQVLNFGDWSLAREFKDPCRVNCVEISSTENFLVSGNDKGVIKLWSLEEWQDEISIQSHNDAVQSIIISSDSKSLYSIGKDKKIIISKVSEFENNFNIKSDSTFIDFIRNFKNDALYGLSREGHITEIRHKTQERIAKLEKPIMNWEIISNGIEIGVIFHPNESKIVETAVVPLSRPRKINYFKYETESKATAAAFSHEGEYLLIGQAFKLSVINIKTGKSHTFRSHTGEVSYLISDKDYVFSGDDVGIIKYFKIHEKFEELGQLVDETHHKVTLIRPLLEERLLFSASSEGSVIIWSIERLVSINKVNLNTIVKEIYFTKNKSHFFICSGFNITIWNVEDLSREALISLPDKIESFMFTCDESYILFAFEDYIKVMENPLTTDNLSIYGDHGHMEKFIKYIVKIINGEFPKHDESMDDWLIEPFHINTLHLYAFFDMPKHLEKSIIKGGSFFNSREGYSPMIISLEKKSYDCIDSIYESLKARSVYDKMSLYRLSSALPGLNRFSYSKLQDLYMIVFNDAFAFEMPKFIENSEVLPKVVKSNRYFIPHWKFAPAPKFKYDEVAVEFKQSFVKINTKIGSSQSLEFMKSLVECQNPSIYTTPLIQIILKDKWRTISLILGAELVLYTVYLLILCYLTQVDEVLFNYELVVALGINFVLFFYEVMQMITSGSLYFTSFWNFIDLSRFICFTTYCVLLYFGYYPTWQAHFFITSVLLSLVRGLSYFRIISSVRWVIKLLFDVVSELWALTFVVLYTGAASFEFYKFLEKENIQAYLPLSEEDFRVQYTTVVFIILINPLIILNLYLAIIGEKLEKSENEKVILDGQELAEMIYEAEILFVCNRKYKKPKFLHVLQEEAPEIQAQRTSSQRIKKMAESVKEIAKSYSKSNKDVNSLISHIKEQTEKFKANADKVINILRP